MKDSFRRPWWFAFAPLFVVLVSGCCSFGDQEETLRSMAPVASLNAGPNIGISDLRQERECVTIPDLRATLNGEPLSGWSGGGRRDVGCVCSLPGFAVEPMAQFDRAHFVIEDGTDRWEMIVRHHQKKVHFELESPETPVRPGSLVEARVEPAGMDLKRIMVAPPCGTVTIDGKPCECTSDDELSEPACVIFDSEVDPATVEDDGRISFRVREFEFASPLSQPITASVLAEVHYPIEKCSGPAQCWVQPREFSRKVELGE